MNKVWSAGAREDPTKEGRDEEDSMREGGGGD